MQVESGIVVASKIQSSKLTIASRNGVLVSALLPSVTVTAGVFSIVAPESGANLIREVTKLEVAREHQFFCRGKDRDIK